MRLSLQTLWTLSFLWISRHTSHSCWHNGGSFVNASVRSVTDTIFTVVTAKFLINFMSLAIGVSGRCYLPWCVCVAHLSPHRGNRLNQMADGSRRRHTLTPDCFLSFLSLSEFVNKSILDSILVSQRHFFLNNTHYYRNAMCVLYRFGIQNRTLKLGTLYRFSTQTRTLKISTLLF